VNLAASDPSGVSFNFGTNPVTPPIGGSAASQLTISAASSAAIGTFQIAITGTGGGLTDSAVLTLVVNAGPQPPPPAQPDFTIYASLASFIVTQGATAQSTISIQSENGFSSAVSLSGSWVAAVPSGVSYSLSPSLTPQPNQATQTTLVINVASTASTGTYTFRIQAQSGTLAHSADISIQVTPRQCLIATATYGSELSPEVQSLRNLRDNMVLRTRAGSAFMSAFNAWYYSFSPAVAQQITHDATLRDAMKVLLYPAVAILKVAATPFTLLPGSGELAAILSGLVASFMLGATYLAIPTTGLLKSNSRLWRRTNSLEKTAAITLLSGLIAVGLGELTSIFAILTVGTSALVLSAVSLGALVTSRLAIRCGNLRKVFN
jgi:peptide/nickel transport system substrate-binding protein